MEKLSKIKKKVRVGDWRGRSRKERISLPRMRRGRKRFLRENGVPPCSRTAQAYNAVSETGARTTKGGQAWAADDAGRDDARWAGRSGGCGPRSGTASSRPGVGRARHMVRPPST